jgi:integrase
MSGLVFQGVGTTGPIAGFRRHWLKIAELGGLPNDITPHVLRHSFASVAADLGFSELTIAALIGHRKGTMTSRYTHHADAVLLAAADKVAEAVASYLQGNAPAISNIIPIPIPAVA